jgi:hypothetical protein
MRASLLVFFLLTQAKAKESILSKELMMMMTSKGRKESDRIIIIISQACKKLPETFLPSLCMPTFHAGWNVEGG